MPVGRIKKYSEIGGRLKELRGESSQLDFSARLNIPFRTYQRYEAGERMPRQAIIQHIANTCGVSMNWVFSGEGSRSDFVAESPAGYGDPQIALIVKSLSDMDKEGKSDVLRYIEAQKLWREKKLKEGA